MRTTLREVRRSACPVFDEKIEVESPGLLPFGLTIDDILRGVSKLRNRVIGRVFKELGLIEQWGSGIGRMIDACREHGLPAPEFEEVGTHFRVTLRLQAQELPPRRRGGGADSRGCRPGRRSVHQACRGSRGDIDQSCSNPAQGARRQGPDRGSRQQPDRSEAGLFPGCGSREEGCGAMSYRNVASQS